MNSEFNFGSLRSLKPVSREFGFDRGLPIDRYYIEQFLSVNNNSIKGRTLEIGDDFYTRRFGGNKIEKADVLHVEEGNSKATIVGDLTNAANLNSNCYDCFICTQTLHLIFDIQKAVKTMYRILKPEGVALVTFPGISQISYDRWSTEWRWGFTPKLAEKLFGEVFGPSNFSLQVFGNKISAVAFLQGIPASELTQEQLDFRDDRVDLLITIAANK